MDKFNYKELCLRTEAPIDDRLRDRLHKTNNIRLLHGVLGVVSEIEELTYAISQGDRVNIGEEICDILWYTSILSDVVGINLDVNFPVHKEVSLQYELEVIMNTSSKMADMIKKTIFYGKEYPLNDWQAAVTNIAISCHYLCKFFSLNVNELKRKNIAKLKERFPNKFSEEDAINRDVQKEREILAGV